MGYWWFPFEVLFRWMMIFSHGSQVVVDNKTTISPSLRATSDLPLYVKVLILTMTPTIKLPGNICSFPRPGERKSPVDFWCDWVWAWPAQREAVHLHRPWFHHVQLGPRCSGDVTVLGQSLIWWQYGDHWPNGYNMIDYKPWWLMMPIVHWKVDDMMKDYNLPGDPNWKTRDDLILFVGSASRSDTWRVRYFDLLWSKGF